MLSHSIFGSDGNLDAVAFAHGFTQTRGSWSQTIDALRADRKYVAIDMPGHGESGAIRADITTAADRLVATAGRAVYCGYSMGARICLHGALQHPQIVQGLILLSTTPGIVKDDQRMERQLADERLAQRIIEIGVSAFIDEWLAQPMFANLPSNVSDREQRSTNTATGLAESLRLCGTGKQLSLWPRLSELKMPVLIIAGEHDKKFADIALHMHHAISTSQLEIVPSSGHTVHYEQPNRFTEILNDWLVNRP